MKKELGQTQSNIDDIARSMGIKMEDILCYDHTREYPLFHIKGMITKSSKPQKIELVKQTEKELLPNHYNYKRQL